MNIQEYIHSGVIEDYCLGIASPQQVEELEGYCDEYPEILSALKAAQDNMLQYLEGFSQTPPVGVLDEITSEIDSRSELEGVYIEPETGQLNQFVRLSKYSDYRQWRTLTKDLQPPADTDFYVHNLYRDDKNHLAVLWFNDQIPEEEHDDLKESFMVLEGECTAYLDDKAIELKTGDYWDIPLYVEHSFKNTGKGMVKTVVLRQAA